MKYQNSKGFTLVEVITVVMLTGILIVGSGVILNRAIQTFHLKKHSSSLRMEGQTALQKLSYEFREADSVTLNSANDVTFTADIDDDGISETVRYRLVGSDFVRISGSTNELCGDVTSLVYTWNSPLLTAELTLSRGGNTVYVRSGMMARSTT